MKIYSNIELVEAQNYVSFFVTSGVVFLNIYYTWASKKAVILTLFFLKYYNILDILINFNYYKKTQPSMLLHHSLVIFLALSLTNHIENNYNYDLYRLVRWVLIAEVTSIFNALRHILHHTCFKLLSLYLFGVVFLLGRFIMSIGLYYDMYNNHYVYMLSPITTILIALNSHWSEMIIFKMRNKQYIHKTIPEIILKYHIYAIPHLAIYASNNNKNYAENMLWIYFAYIFCYYYKPVYLSLK